MKRPVIEIQQEPFDQVLYVLGIIGLFLLIACPLYYFNSLPEEIPTHFNGIGEPDGFQNKWNLWLMPGIGVVLYAFLHWFSKLPHRFNYPVKITTENATFQYANGVRMLRFFQTSLMLVLAYISFMSIQTALGAANGLGESFSYIFMSIIIGGLIYFAYKSASA